LARVRFAKGSSVLLATLAAASVKIDLRRTG
jgi:hypothetical protein